MTAFTISHMLRILASIELQLSCYQTHLSTLDRNDPSLEQEISDLEKKIENLSIDKADYSSWIERIPLKYPL